MSLFAQKYSKFMTQSITDFIKAFLCSQCSLRSFTSNQNAQTLLSLVICMQKQARLSCPDEAHIFYQD